ncbi:MAG: ATP synthase F0 subunit C [Bdellovibrionales bacterium]|nr:ATP synthase F0 subunit C [Bdellovibrionales bacterium]
MIAGVLVTGAAFAQEGAHAAAASSGLDLVGLGAGLGLGLAAMGGAIGQGKTAAAALEGISRNPAASGKITTPMIIGLALIESLVIYALIIAILKIK